MLGRLPGDDLLKVSTKTSNAAMSRREASATVVMCAAVLTTACGSTQINSTPTTHSAVPSPTASSSPSPTPAVVGPLLSLATASGPNILMEPDGQQTGVLAQTPTTPYIRSPFGNQLFGILNYGSFENPVLDAINPDGSWTSLGTAIPQSHFVDAIGDDAGGAWALVTVGTNCTRASRATLDVGTASGMRVVATLPALVAVWQLRSFNAAGIVLQAVTCDISGTVLETELVNPNTGSVTNLTSVLGATCPVFVDISDSGAMLCSDRDGVRETAFTVVDAAGAPHQYQFPIDAEYCTGDEAGLGISPDVISDDAKYIAVSDSCMYPGENGGRQQLLIINTTSGVITRGPTSLYLEPEMWLPDDELVVSEPTLSGEWTGGTWVVSPDGSARAISSTGTAQSAG